MRKSNGIVCCLHHIVNIGFKFKYKIEHDTYDKEQLAPSHEQLRLNMISFIFQNLWVADSFLNQSYDSLCEEPVCSNRSIELACGIMNNTDIELRKDHPSKKVDSAYAHENMNDTCNGRAACRSM